MPFKDPTFEAVEIGETFGPVTVEMDEHYLKNAMFAVDDFGSWYLEGDPAVGGRIVPSTAVARDLVALFLTKYDANRVVGLHQKEEVWFKSPIPFGTRLIYTGKYVDKYHKRGKGYVVFDCEARDESGQLFVRQVSTEIMRIPEQVELGSGSARPSEGQVKGEWPTDRKPVEKAHTSIEPGTPIATLTKRAYQDQMSVFSGANKQWHNIHTDDNVARAAGFRDTLAQGMTETCWTSEMLTNFFGPSWLSTGWIKMIYLKPVYRDDIITCFGVVTGHEEAEGIDRVQLEIWCANQDGEMTAAGWASGSLG
ncbi:MAG: MaoC family dehydratase [bacterium]